MLRLDLETRLEKRDSADLLTLTLEMFADRVELRLDKRLCLKCDVCALTCPRQAVAIIPGEETLDIDIDPRRCVLCEICSHFCPAGAVKLFNNGEPKAIFAAHQGLAVFFTKDRHGQGQVPGALPAPGAGPGALVPPAA